MPILKVIGSGKLRSRLELLTITISFGFLTTCLLAQPIARLYRLPPPNASFVRVLNATSAAADIQLSSNKDVTVVSLPAESSSPFHIVDAPGKIDLRVGGIRVAANLSVDENRFVTLVLLGDLHVYRVKLISEVASALTGLAAELRLYNVIDGCLAGIQVASGPKIFEAIAPFDIRRREINPVKASLVGSCSTTMSSAVELPIIEVGSRVSLFLMRESKHPILKAQIDETDDMREPH
jgi:alginate O-acetyltransferase complex protein AlgF